ncbi:MAG: uridine diphosphate-N-acetylglucosamine-binding protein YvcK [Mycoplasmatales bacterium]
MKKIFIFGGGTGLSNLLSALKETNYDIKVAVTTSDNGGSTGKIRDYYGMPALGDLRKVLNATIADQTLHNLVEYRFDEKIENHTIGNLILAALINMDNNISEAVSKYSRIFNIPFSVYPVTNQPVHLHAKMECENVIIGETQIVQHPQKIKEIFYNLKVHANQDVIQGIAEADYIIFSSGSLYTSLISNLIINDIKKALKKSKAHKIYISNIMTQKGETDNYQVSDHIKAIEKHTYKNIIDIVIANNYKNISTSLKQKYQSEGSELVNLDPENLKNTQVIQQKLIKENSFIRHDIMQVKEILEKIIEGNNE